MKWSELVAGSFHYNYAVAEKLISQVSDADLSWKPSTGSNWMTVGQLLFHITEACGWCCKGFATGDWGMPPEAGASEAEANMLPPAEKMRSVSSVAEALELLAKDKELAFVTLNSCSEERLDTEPAPAPWDPMTPPLGRRFLEMAAHLQQHKGQLFYYLKLMGKPVNTNDLWGA